MSWNVRSRDPWRAVGRCHEGGPRGDRGRYRGRDTQTYEVAATRAGRRVEVSTGRGMVEVTEVTRTGTAVRTARFMASRIIALVEHPADTSAAD